MAPVPHRSGNALIMAMGAIVVLLGLAISLSDLTVGRFGEQVSRQDQVELMAAAESAANEAIEWMRTNTTFIKVMPAHPEVVQVSGSAEPRSAQQQYEFLATLPAGHLIDSEALPSGSSAMFPGIAQSSGGTVIGCGDHQRNGARVRARIICLKQTESGNQWPDGFEKFLVFATAEQGDQQRSASRYRRARVQAVVSTSSTKVFKQAFYARQKYTCTGNMKTKSWAGNGATVTTSTHNGDVSSGDQVVVAGSATIDGDRCDNVNLALPPVVYAPAAGATSLGVVSSPITITGGTNYRATSLGAGVTVSGSGPITLWVDGAINLSNIRWATGSTAKVTIIQSPNSSGSPTLDVHGGDRIGYLGTTTGLLGPSRRWMLPVDVLAAAMLAANSNSNAGGGSGGGGGSTTYAPIPSRLMIISGYKGDFTINGNGEVAAVIYAPYANVKMNGTGVLFGAVIADAFNSKVNGTFDFWYDDTLGSLSLPLDPQFSATAWNLYYPSFAQQ